MSANVEFVRTALAVWLAGDTDRAAERVDPDVVSMRVPPILDPQTY